ncbi:MAG: dienelactone hydrolase family protein [Woeseia sp.]|nr:dienelactone hydrolase family protein [Woeseia sp.]MBT8096818.1 dienelactone hydrolase family protein [Woeseia sp.]
MRGAAEADWQLHAYGNTMHAFTNPQADDPAHGLRDAPVAERRAWQSMQDFFKEIFK